MSALLDIYIKAETLETLQKTVAKKGMKGLAITVSVNDETNEHGQNVAAFVSQSKEDRAEGKKKFYVGNGKVFWMKGGISVASKQDEKPRHDAPPAQDDSDDDLPF